MHNFARKLITEWRRLGLPFQSAAFVVAVSGGADSVSLLLALDELQRAKKLNNRLVAAHFNHKLRGEESDADEQSVKQLAGALRFELVVGHARIPEAGNKEQNARTARYQFLRKAAENLGAEGVITAHTQNDQAETFLMNLIRGSGPDGLGGMKAVREIHNGTVGQWDSGTVGQWDSGTVGQRDSGTAGQRDSGTAGQRDSETAGQRDSGTESPFLPFSPLPGIMLVRPLLNWALRRDTESYCHDRDVEYRYDSMNEDLSFTRVRIRKLLLPMLEEFNPRIVETLANTARLMQRGEEEQKPPSEIENSDLDNGLELKMLKSLEKGELYRTLRQWLARKRGNTRSLSLKHIEAIERLALSRKSGRAVELPGGGSVTKTRGTLVYGNLGVEKRPFGN